MIEVIRTATATIYRSDHTSERVTVTKSSSTCRLGSTLIGQNRWRATLADGTVIADVDTASAAKASALRYMKRRVALSRPVLP